jgi:hypothetical protein
MARFISSLQPTNSRSSSSAQRFCWVPHPVRRCQEPRFPKRRVVESRRCDVLVTPRTLLMLPTLQLSRCAPVSDVLGGGGCISALAPDAKVNITHSRRAVKLFAERTARRLWPCLRVSERV